MRTKLHIIYIKLLILNVSFKTKSAATFTTRRRCRRRRRCAFKKVHRPLIFIAVFIQCFGDSSSLIYVAWSRKSASAECNEILPSLLIVRNVAAMALNFWICKFLLFSGNHIFFFMVRDRSLWVFWSLKKKGNLKKLLLYKETHTQSYLQTTPGMKFV